MNSINFTTQLTTRDFTNICIYKLVKHSKDWSQVAGIDLEADLIFVVDFESGIIDPLGGEVRVRGSNRVDEDGIDSLKAVQQCSSAAVQRCKRKFRGLFGGGAHLGTPYSKMKSL